MTDLEREAIRAALRAFPERNVLCPDRCAWGWVATDPTDIDPYTLSPRTSHCPRCKGRGFIPRQSDLFPETLS